MKQHYPDIQILDYIEEGDFFVEHPRFKALSDQLGLTEWHSLTWIGQLMSLDNNFGEDWFDNDKERDDLKAVASALGYDADDIMIVKPQRFMDGENGPCHSDSLRKLFWTDVLRNLKISLRTILLKARASSDLGKALEPQIQAILEQEGIAELVEPEAPTPERPTFLYFTVAQVQEIADFLGSGMNCYIHKKDRVIKMVIDSDVHAGGDLEFWEEDLKEIDEHRNQYFLIRDMPSRDSFIIMEGFVDQVRDRNLKNRLLRALNNRKPFKNFKYLIDDSEYREQWFDYRRQERFNWVAERIKEFEQLIG